MSTNPSLVEYIHGKTRLGSALAFKKMFGEYAVYLHGRVAASACDNHFFLKPTAAGRTVLVTVSEHLPYPGTKIYFRIDEQREDRELLRAAFETTACGLPLPKAKAKPDR